MGEVPLTVVIPVFNREDSLAATVASVARQRFGRVSRTLVVDDASTDNSASVAERLGCDVIRLERNGGSATARNAGMERVSTPWVAFLDSDDEWHDDLLTVLWPHTARHVLVAGAALLKVGGETLTLLGATRPPGQWLASPADLLTPANPVVTSCTLVRTDVVRSLDGFDASLRFSEDLDLWLRVLERGSGWCDATPVMTYHRGPSSKSQATHGDVEAARAGIVRAYASRPWWTRDALDRYLGGMYFEGMRSALRGGQHRRAAEHLARAVGRPRRVQGLLESVSRNYALRRRAAQLGA